MRASLRILATLATLLGVACNACDRGAMTHPSPVASSDPNVHVLTLPESEATLPDAPGRSITIGSCLTCHSSRYIADQPMFSRKTWTAEVEKMKKTYGAPIDDASVKPIVDYLVVTHGREE